MADPFAKLNQGTDPFAKLEEPVEQAQKQDPFTRLSEESPDVKSGKIDDADLQEIAKRRGVSIDTLKAALPYFTGVTGPSTPETDVPQKLAGEAGKIAFELPQKLYVLSQSSPKTQAALDDLRELIEDRKTTGQIAAEIGVGIGSAVAAAVATGGASLAAPIGRAILPEIAGETTKRAVARAAIGGAAEGAAAGAVTGAARARTGEELGGAAKGTILPGVFGAAGGAAVRGAQRYFEIRGIKEKAAIEAAEQLVAENDDKIAAKIAASKDFDDGIIGAIQQRGGMEAIQAKAKELTKIATRTTAEDAELATLAKQANQIKEFGEFVSGKRGLSFNKAAEEIEKNTRIFGEQIGETYNAFRRAQAASEILPDIAAGSNSKIKQMFGRLGDLFIAGRYTAGGIDRRIGTTLVRTMDDFAPRNTALQIRQAQAQSILNKFVKEANELNLKPETIYKAMKSSDDVEEMGRIAGSKEAGELLGRMKAFQEEVRKDLGVKTDIKSALNVEFRKNYIPQKTADDAVIIGRLDVLNKRIENELDIKLAAPSKEATASMQTLLDEYNNKIRDLIMPANKTLTAAEKATVDEFNERAGSLGTLFHAVDYLQAGDAMPKNIKGVLRFSRSLDNTEFLGARTEKIAGSALERSLNAPDVVLEQNPFRLMSKYAFDMYRVAHFKDTIDELKAAQQIAERTGDTRAEAWITNALKDLAGIRPRTGLAVYKQVTQAIQVSAIKRANEAKPGSVTHTAMTYLAESPEMFGNMLNSVYPNFLGANVQAFVNNLGGATFSLAPEVGIANAPKVMKAYFRLAKMMVEGYDIMLSPTSVAYMNATMPKKDGTLYKVGELFKTRNPSLVTMNTLNGAGSVSGEAFNMLQKSLDSNVLFRSATKVTNAWANFSMFFFEKAESINRFVALSVGQDIALEIAEKATSKGSKVVLDRMEPAYRKAMNAAIEAGDRGEIQRLTQRWLVAKTMFDYNRINQPEAARFMGPLFSVFTTYPANVAGDMLETLRAKGAVKGGGELFQRRILPLLAATVIGNYAIPDEGENAVVDLMFGKEKLAAMAPAQSIVSLGTRGVSPPGIAIAGQGIKAAATLDLYEFWRFFNSGTAAFVPNASMIRFISDEIPTALDRKPESKTLIGKAVETFSGGKIMLDEDIREFTKDYKERFANPFD